MTKKNKQIVVPRDQAVFRLDDNGRWHNVHGEFRHKKIIDYFNAAIQRDEGGYYLGQINGDVEEKVYFPHGETALFVFQVSIGEDAITLVLNTGKRIPLDSDLLFVRNDHLYMKLGDEIVKFTEQSLMKISPLLEQSEERLFIRVGGRRYPIAQG